MAQDTGSAHLRSGFSAGLFHGGGGGGRCSPRFCRHHSAAHRPGRRPSSTRAGLGGSRAAGRPLTQAAEGGRPTGSFGARQPRAVEIRRLVFRDSSPGKNRRELKETSGRAARPGDICERGGSQAQRSLEPASLPGSCDWCCYLLWPGPTVMGTFARGQGRAADSLGSRGHRQHSPQASNMMFREPE